MYMQSAKRTQRKGPIPQQSVGLGTLPGGDWSNRCCCLMQTRGRLLVGKLKLKKNIP